MSKIQKNQLESEDTGTSSHFPLLLTLQISENTSAFPPTTPACLPEKPPKVYHPAERPQISTIFVTDFVRPNNRSNQTSATRHLSPKTVMNPRYQKIKI